MFSTQNTPPNDGLVACVYSGGTRLTLKASNIVSGTTVTLVVRIVISANSFTPQETIMPSVRILLFSSANKTRQSIFDCNSDSPANLNCYNFVPPSKRLCNALCLSVCPFVYLLA